MIIDDTTDLSRLNFSGGRGYVPRNVGTDPHGGYAAPFSMELIPEVQWPDLIADMNRTKSSPLDVAEDAGIPPMNQAYTNYCWGYGTADCLQIVRQFMGLDYILLSPDSVCAPMTQYANANGRPAGVGGWPSRFLQYLIGHGIAPASVWPLHRIDKSLDNAATQAARKNLNTTEWWDSTPNASKQLRRAQVFTLLFNRTPFSGAYSWASHVMTGAKPLYKNGQFGIKMRNSGALRDSTGHTELWGDRAIPDDWCAPRVALAS